MSKPQIFGLVDANSFYVSCERTFDPTIWFKPVAVLSNNDGCAISLSKEVKDLGVLVGAPAHQLRDLIRTHLLEMRSSNYELYGNMSNRVMQSLTLLCPSVDVYSIDEAFVNLTGVPNLHEFAWASKAKVMQWTHIPTSWGISLSKTLAKLANKMAKKYAKMRGILVLTEQSDIDAALEMFDVGDIWGVGRKQHEKLKKQGITNARQLRDMDDKDIYKVFNTVVMVRLIWELRGIPCGDIIEAVQMRKNVGVSRTFSGQVGDIEKIRKAIATHVSRCAEKLRRRDLAAKSLEIYIKTDPYKFHLPQRYSCKQRRFSVPTNNTFELLEMALELLDELYEDGIVYRKAGVNAGSLVPISELQTGIFQTRDRHTDADLFNRMDWLNKKYGRGTIRTGREGWDKSWRTIRQHRSPSYTTDFTQLAVATI